MASISGTTNNLSSTLQGYGGMASGIDRDSIIEQMTLGTTTKISNVKKEKTELQWKQEAYQSLSDKVLDLQDNYFTYSSSMNLKSSSVFAANVVTAIGDDDVTKYISASGASSLVDKLSILAVKQTASAATVLSGEKGSNQAIVTEISGSNLNSTANSSIKTSKLAGKKLEFGTYGYQDKWNSAGTFTFPTSYTKSYEYVDNGDGTITCTKLNESKTIEIDYTAEPEELVKQLNEAIWANDTTIGGDERTIQFGYENGTFTMTYVGIKNQSTDDTNVNKITITPFIENLSDEEKKSVNGNIKLRADSSAVAGLGSFKVNDDGKTIDFAVSGGLTSTDFKDKYVGTPTMAEYIKGRSLTVTYGGESASITLLTQDEYDQIQAIYEDENEDEATKNEEAMNVLKKGIQNRLDKAFGQGKVSVRGGKENDQNVPLSFQCEADSEGNVSTLSINSSDAELRKNLGIEKNESNKVSMDASLWENRETLGFITAIENNLIKQNKENFENNLIEQNKSILEENVKTRLGVNSLDGINNIDELLKEELYKLDKVDELLKEELYKLGNINELLDKEFEAALKNFTINGVTIKDITKDTTVNELLSKINNNSEVGVKASYLSGTGQFVLVADKTGTGRMISLNLPKDADDNKTVNAANALFGGGTSTDGQDAEMEVSYGNGVTTTVKSSSNTFNLEGMKVTVSGTFGYTTENGVEKLDSSQAVTFQAKADVEGVTEQVKKFIEEYNALVEDLYNQTNTRPDRDYAPLTDEQKDEMSDKEIENWEKKAKEGILFRESTVKDLYSDMQMVISKMISKDNGLSYSDLESIGITTSDSKADYGKLIFDESKFKEAMETDAGLVSKIFAGGGDVKKGLAQTIEDTLTPYATRYAVKNGNSYGRLIEEAGSSKLVLSTTDNFIYEQLKKMDEEIKTLQARLKSEQDRYISQFTTMESLISKYNTQSSYIMGLSG